MTATAAATEFSADDRDDLDAGLAEQRVGQRVAVIGENDTRFERDRKPNADAIATMALENYVEMRDTVRHPKYQLQKALSLELERRFPRHFIPRYSMVMFHHEIPYAAAYERGRLQQQVLDELSAGIERPEQVDWDQAARSVHTHLRPLR